MPTYTFDEVARSVTRKFQCTVCGRRGQRTKRFTQTINPFNRTADGDVKTRAQIEAELASEASAWTTDSVHDSCRDARPEPLV